MKGFSNEAKVGLLAIVAVAAALYFISRVDDIPAGAERGRGYTLYAELDDVSGVYKATGVYIRGVKVGVVEEIVLRPNDEGETVARLRMRMQPKVKLNKDSTLSAQPSGLLGDKNLVITPGVTKVGESEDSFMQDGDYFVVSGTGPDINEILERAETMTSDIEQVTTVMRESLGSEEAEVRMESMLANIERFSADMAEVSSANREALEEVVENLRVLSEELREVAGRANTGVNNSFDDLEQAADKLDATLASVSSISRKIDDGEGTLGRLINDEGAADGIDSAIDGVNELVERFNRVHIFIDYHAEAQTGPTFGFDRGIKNYFGIQVQTHPDYFYALELVDDPRGKVTTKETTFIETDNLGNTTTRTVQETKVEDQFTFSAQLARRLQNATFRLGLKEGSGGIGMDYNLLKDRFKLSLDAYEFSRENENPHLKVMARYDVHEHIFVVGGVDDMISRQDNLSYFMGAGFAFTDDDLKFVLGALPLGGN